MEPGKSPSRFWYFVLAAFIALGGLAGFVYFLVSGLTGMADDLIRINAPGVHEIKLDRPGAYTIFLELPENINQSENTDYQTLNGLSVRLETFSGLAIPVGPASGASTYSFGGRRGFSVMSFKIDHSGRYRFIASFTRTMPARPVVLTMMQGFMGRLFKMVLTGAAVFGGAILASAVVLGLALTRRRKPEAPTAPGLPPPIG